MAISDKLTYLNETKSQLKTMISYGLETPLSNETFREYVNATFQALINSMSSWDNLTWSNLPKVTGTGTEMTLNNTYTAPMKINLKGNTEQTTYSGKNLFNINGNFRQGYLGDTGVVVYTAQSVTLIDYIPVEQNKSYICSYDVIVSDSQFRGVAYYDENKNYLSRLSGNLKFTTPANCAFIRVYFYNPNNMSVEQLPSYIQNIQIEQGSTATSYEPFVGGSPSPSPDYPQPVKVVTGDNTITIGDGTNSENYSINIGSIELCKIGDYQDYIYKSGDKWYKKAYIGKLVLDGSEENLIYNSTLNRLQMPFNLQTQDWVALALTLCNHFISGDTEIVDGSFNITRTTLYFKNIDLTSLNDWKTWLESNNTSVYYVLATPTNTEITDTDLIEQLETIRTAKSVENKTIISQTNADLPFIISASALSKN